MIVIEGPVRIPPANLEAARSAMEQMIRASRAEPGCIDYAYSLDVLDPGLVRVTERWQSREALKAHFAAAHMATWRAFFPQLGITDRSLRLYEADPEPI
ncbi:MAG TPA: antibiotic biosynthesis monooxygenase [Hyphomonas sp.]|nr:antibiotic biosynthesis monooxygenase [Hyphomonas sp.]